MTVLAENDLQISLPASVTGRKFDDGATHGLSHCMKAVDFIVELADRVLGASTLSDAELLARTDALKRQLPVTGPDARPWKKPFVAGCAVMNLAAWNKALPQFPASRVGP